MPFRSTLPRVAAVSAYSPFAASISAKFGRPYPSFIKTYFSGLLLPAGQSWAAISARTDASRGRMYGSNRTFASHNDYPKGLERDMKDTTNIPVGGENLYRRVGGPGYPMLFDVKYDRPTWQPLWEDEHEVIPRDGYGYVCV